RAGGRAVLVDRRSRAAAEEKAGQRDAGEAHASRLGDHALAAQYLRTARGASRVPSISRNGRPGAPRGNAKLPVFAYTAPSASRCVWPKITSPAPVASATRSALAWSRSGTVPA